jgi:hypothetical protein
MMDFDTLNHLKDTSFYGLLFLTLGSSYYVGDYLIGLLYRPLEKEYFPARMKNKFYKSATRRKTNEILEPLLNTSRNISSISN